MSDKGYCPRCDVYLSRIEIAIWEGEPCPQCALPTEQLVASFERELK